ncbi:Glyceraldehyde-3-phosphate dehydrogenase [Paramyrothecium foliicola]|nr:Glyceraldehyde-3-phosphate dehydrogenase [Paramyrothecium foliicola]
MAPSAIDNSSPAASFSKPKVAKLGINGFGRIGRSDVQVVAINHTCASVDDLIYLIRHDTTHGLLRTEIHIGRISDDAISINGETIILTSTREIRQLDWGKLGVEYVLECTGKFTKAELALRHVTEANCKRVIISAPSPDSPTFVYGVNSDRYKASPETRVVSAASCTTNCVTPLLRLLNDTVGIEQAFLTTIHAATQSQHILDGYSKKSRRLGRSIFNNVIPTTTGASKAVAAVLPELSGKVTGISIRVPTSNVSLVDLTVSTKSVSSLPEILKVFGDAAKSGMAGILSVSDEDLVSSDLCGSAFSTTVDATACMELNPRFFKIIAWYDNELGYATRLLDLATLMCSSDSSVASLRFYDNAVLLVQIVGKEDQGDERI